MSSGLTGADSVALSPSHHRKRTREGGRALWGRSRQLGGMGKCWSSVDHKVSSQGCNVPSILQARTCFSSNEIQRAWPASPQVMLIVSFASLDNLHCPEHLETALQFPDRPIVPRIARITQAKQSIVEILEKLFWQVATNEPIPQRQDS